MKSGVDHFDLLFKCIQVYGGTSVPGLGTLWIDFRSASIDKKNQIIYPPSGFLQYTSEYNKSFDTSIQLTQLGIHQFNVEKFIQFLQREIIISKDIFINNVGNLSIADGDQKVFNVTNHETFNKFFGLPPLKAVPVKKFVGPENKKTLPQINKSNTKLSLKTILNAIIILLSLFLVYRIVYHFTPNNNINKTSNFINITKNLIDTPKAPLKTTPNEKYTSFPPSEIPDAKDDSCVYVLGSFTVKDNALNMKNVLEKNGYQVFTSSFGKFERVGIKMICVKDSSSENWLKLKEQYPDLWVLDTQI